jgi:hypothetical protein
VSTFNDAEGNINAGPEEKKTDEEVAASAYAAVADSSGKFAVPESSMAVAAPDILPDQRKGVSVLGSFCMSSYMI